MSKAAHQRLQAVLMEETPHSRYGASSLYRLKACAGSANLILSSGAPNTTSRYAAEGTVAHAVGSICLNGEFVIDDFMGTEVTYAGFKFTVDAEMLAAVRVYVETVFAEVGAQGVLFVEQRFHLKEVHEDAFGTSDAAVLQRASRKLVVADYKHGAGEFVVVEDNDQLKYYALGALLAIKAPVDDIELLIVQPRCERGDPVRRWSFKAVELLEFYAELREIIAKSEAPDAPLAGGGHCGWCPAAPVCPELRRVRASRAKRGFMQEKQWYDPTVLAQDLAENELLEASIKATRELAFNEAMSGRTVPGWKLVAKQARRQWRDVKAAATALVFDLGIAKTTIYEEPSLKSVAQIEKLLPKADRAALAALVVKESSGLTLAPESDKREAATRDSASHFETEN